MTYRLQDKLILTDADGVLLDWKYSFFRWMQKRGHEVKLTNSYDISKVFDISDQHSYDLIEQFNESANIGWIPSFRDSVKYVRELHEKHGFVFHCITSLSKDQYAGMLRTMNLEQLFGKTVFEKIEFLDCGANKHEVLLPYKDSGCLWIEDKPENAVDGYNLGLNSVLISHDFNDWFEHPYITKVDTWRDIYEMLV